MTILNISILKSVTLQCEPSSTTLDCCALLWEDPVGCVVYKYKYALQHAVRTGISTTMNQRQWSCSAQGSIMKCLWSAWRARCRSCLCHYPGTLLPSERTNSRKNFVVVSAAACNPPLKFIIIYIITTHWARRTSNWIFDVFISLCEKLSILVSQRPQVCRVPMDSWVLPGG